LRRGMALGECVVIGVVKCVEYSGEREIRTEFSIGRDSNRLGMRKPGKARLLTEEPFTLNDPTLSSSRRAPYWGWVVTKSILIHPFNTIHA
jgi:hypothetical protein